MDNILPNETAIYAPLVTFLVALLLTPRLFRYAQIKLVDVPVERSSHKMPTPKGGGLGFASAILVGLILVQPAECALLFFTSFSILLVSFFDDLKGLHQLPRVSVHFIAAAALVLLMPSWPSLVPLNRLEDSALFVGFLFIIYLVWFVNLFNFMDGIDGLALSEGIFVSLGFAMLSWWGAEPKWTIVYIATTLALLVFLKWNWPPAKMFMGDSGSAFLGWWFGAGTLLLARNPIVPVWLPLMLVSVFVMDATFTLIRRFVNGEQVFDAHRTHLYQVLSVYLGGHREAVILYMGLNVLLVCPMVVAAVKFPSYAASLCASLYSVLLCLYVVGWACVRYANYRHQNQSLTSLGIRRSPLVVLLAADGVAVVVAFFSSYLVRLDFSRMSLLNYEILLAPIVGVASCYAFYRLGVYRIAVRNMLNADLWVLSLGATISAVILAASGFMTQAFMPRSLPLVYFLILLSMIGGGRVVFRAVYRARIKPQKIPTLIVILEGESRYQLSDLNLDPGLLPVGILNSRAELKGEVFNGLKIFSPSQLEEVIEALNVRYILVLGGTVPRYIARYWERSGQQSGVTIYCLVEKQNRIAKHYAPKVSTWIPANLVAKSNFANISEGVHTVDKLTKY